MAKKKTVPGPVEDKVPEQGASVTAEASQPVAVQAGAAGKPRWPGVQFQPGNKGGPGRPKGSRNKLTMNFVAEMCQDFELHGAAVIESVRRDKPEVYLKVIASLVPQQIEVGDAGAFAELSDKELDGYIAERGAQLAALASQMRGLH
jgi:hypothetical protein